MSEYSEHLDEIRRINQAVDFDTAPLDMEEARGLIERELLAVIDPLAAFINALDDGTGWSNTTSEFATLLLQSLDWAHRLNLLTSGMWAPAGLSLDDKRFIRQSYDIAIKAAEPIDRA